MKININLKEILKRILGMDSKVQARGTYTLTTRNKENEITNTLVLKNKIVTSGVSILPKFLTGELLSLDEGSINYCALGDGNTAVDTADIALDNEVFRKTITSKNPSGNSAILTLFLNHTEANITIKEIGMFINGTSVADSGTLFSRVSEENSELPITKQDSETLTIEYKVDFLTN